MQYDSFIKRRESPVSVIPVQTGIQFFESRAEHLDPVLQRGDGFFHFIKYYPKEKTHDVFPFSRLDAFVPRDASRRHRCRR
jgi:hypothetical protein